MRSRGAHHDHAHDAGEQHHVVLALVIAAFLDLVGGEQHHDVAGEQEEALHHETEVVDDVTAVEHRSNVVAGHAEGDHGQQRGEQHEARQRRHDPPLAVGDEQVDEQNHRDPDAENDLGRERVIVDLRRHEVCGGEQRREHSLLPEHRGELIDGGVHDLEEKLRIHTEHEDRDEQRRPGEPLEDRHVVDVVVMLVVGSSTDGMCLW